MAETLLDVKGLNCPLPVLRANRVLRGLAPGEKLRVLATDRASIAFSEEVGTLSFTIRRRPYRPDELPDAEPGA